MQLLFAIVLNLITSNIGTNKNAAKPLLKGNDETNSKPISPANLNQAGIDLLKVNHRNIRTRGKICSKSTIKTRRY